MLMRLLLVVLLAVSGTAHADIILLLSDDTPSVSGVGQAIQATYQGKVEIHKLAGNRSRENEIVQTILESESQQVVAVGLLAAQVARQRLYSKQVVFCQVLNFEEFDLVTPWMKGVSAIPSMQRQFAVWKLLDPSLRRVGIVTGRNSRYMVAEAEAAARRAGIDLIHVEAASERAVAFAAQELYDKKIQGIWLAPDSSILSRRAVLDLMSFCVRHGVQVLAFTPALLKEGALISATSDFQEIARNVLDRLKRSTDSSVVIGEPLRPLGNARITVSGLTASRFGLSVSPRLREQADVE
jgi:ABC-type uncharacterized transport system substrate-binding protein